MRLFDMFCSIVEASSRGKVFDCAQDLMNGCHSKQDIQARSAVMLYLCCACLACLEYLDHLDSVEY